MPDVDCIVCMDAGCEHCPAVKVAHLEPFPAEILSEYTDAEIFRLALDVRGEIVRRGYT